MYLLMTGLCDGYGTVGLCGCRDVGNTTTSTKAVLFLGLILVCLRCMNV